MGVDLGQAPLEDPKGEAATVRAAHLPAAFSKEAENPAVADVGEVQVQVVAVRIPFLESELEDAFASAAKPSP